MILLLLGVMEGMLYWNGLSAVLRMAGTWMLRLRTRLIVDRTRPILMN